MALVLRVEYEQSDDTNQLHTSLFEGFDMLLCKVVLCGAQEQ